jgi:hypothetical protein
LHVCLSLHKTDRDCAKNYRVLFKRFIRIAKIS